MTSRPLETRSRPPAPRPDPDDPGVGTTGHEWDGIREWNNPLPRWWLWVFYATIVWGIGYTIAYPAWPLLDRATQGLLGGNARTAVAAEIAAQEARNADLNAALARLLDRGELGRLPEEPGLHGYALNMGAAVFRAHCSQCHGAGAGGVEAQGFPSLLDDAWLWGGTLEDIAHTVAHGIRTDASPEARWSEMPAFADILSRPQTEAVVHHVLALSGQAHDAALAAEGAPLFADHCASCHGEAGRGDRTIGAPDLADAVWLYGGTPEAIRDSIRQARFGVMPAWSREFRQGSGLGPAEIAAVAAYVHALGGGE
ncbi:cytochrome-c oxidase, cbb3-type subunit III [Rubellimicrobium sp. CFH 75288]|uniref:cytochrome-c oxidase, cbb3-type subunit III n=1 Tax=Rubellimicrobium sp. CFH 75288 TaxID=2697034 RepID=UPI0014125595|nr:cytochrome-c oxidase, cbb3-type subunit III [Rubellimicrobium sp. CFH 75288]NAZ36733.1 cytochrome-c oxidase, cbb3-type subunit III [Rubellimicrobium sp. CFH 75288]